MEELIATLTTLRALRSSVGYCFQHLADGFNNEQTANWSHTRFLLEFQENQINIRTRLNELESHVNNLQLPTAPLRLGNTVYLQHAATQELQSLYSELVTSYRWYDQLHERSALAHRELYNGNLYRNYLINLQHREALSFVYSSHQEPLDHLLMKLSFPNSTYNVCRVFGKEIVAFVTITRILKAAMICRRNHIEFIAVRGYDEPLENNNMMDTESRYEVFRMVQNHMQAAMQQFFSLTTPNLSFMMNMKWIDSYGKLFLEPCAKCKRFLSSKLPPTWRDYITLLPYHFECRNC